MNQTAPADLGRVGRLARRLPFFYGWVIVLISFLCVFVMGATSFWAVPTFVDPMHDDTGWSHASIFAGLTVYFISAAAGGLVAGRFTDREGGAARLLAAGILIEAVALIALRWVATPLEFVLVYGVAGGAGGTGLRLVQSTLIAKWFVVLRGRAVGFAVNGGSFSALIMVPVITLLISQLGWRDAWAALGVLMALLLLPFIPFAIRAPEDIGLLPDNGMGLRATGRSAAGERSYALPEVIRTRQFWFLLVGALIGTYSLQAHTVVMLPYFENIGFSAGTAATGLSVYGLFSIIARFIWGMLADRQGARIAIIFQATVTAVGAVILVAVDSKLTLFLAMAFQGMVMSGYPPLVILLWPEFFGRVHIGSIIGVTQFFSSTAGALGPVVAGFLFDSTGTYETALWMLLGTWLTCALVMLSIRPPREAPAPVESPA